MENANTSKKFTISSSPMISILGWVGTTSIILATVVRAAGVSNFMDLVLTCIGCGFWGIAAHITQNKALLTVNVFSVLIVGAGIIRHFFT